MPLFQSRTACVSVFQDGVDLPGKDHPNGGFIIGCKPGTVTIRIRNLTDAAYDATINLAVRPSTVEAGLEYSFDLVVGVDSTFCFLQWTERRGAALFFDIA